MDRLVNIGFGNMVNAAHVVAVVSPDSAPSRRIAQSARDEGRVIDATQGRKTRSLLVMEGGQIVLSALQPETIAARYNGKELQGVGLSEEEAGNNE